jgi:hypothetical protein
MGKPTPDSVKREPLLAWLTADATRTPAAAVAHFWPDARGPDVARLSNNVRQWLFKARRAQTREVDDVSEGAPPPPPPPPPPKLRLVPTGRPHRPTEPPPPPPPVQVAPSPLPEPQSPLSLLEAAPTDELGRESFLCTSLRALDRQLADKADHPSYASSWVAAVRARATLHAELMTIREAQRKASAASGLTPEGRRAELARLGRTMATTDLEAVVGEYLARVGGKVVAADLESTG